MNSPSQIGRYHVIGRIASGGMAEILLAKVLGPGGFERAVVIKRVLPHLVSQREFRDMFLDEARIVAAIHHPNVVQVHELGRDDGELFLVMEYLAGESVRSLWMRTAARGQRLDLGLSAHIVAEACAGLHAAHEFTDPDGKPKQVVHRDVCPNNLFLTYGGSVKVVDFGIAQTSDRFTLTEAGQVKGKAAYMSPEQCLRQSVDRRTDVFALGVVLYELTTGHRLFGGALESRILASLTKERVQPPSKVVRDYPAELERICMRALRFDPAERFATAEDMRRALVRFQRSRAGDILPEEQLKARMHDLFQDRIEEKAELLRRLRAGSGVNHIPTAEVSDEVSVPVVEADRELPPSALASAGPTRGGVVRPSRRRRSRRTLALATGATALLAILLSLLFTAKVEKPHSLVVRTSVQAATPQKSRLLGQPPERMHSVTIELASHPAGAGVWIEDGYRGKTPIALILPRRKQAVRLKLELEGHGPLEQLLVPDVDQRLLLSLPQRRSLAKAPDSKSTLRSKKRPEGEFFLFE